MAYNSQWAPCSTPSRRILRNETGSDPGGQHGAQYRVQGLSGAQLDDDATPVSRPLNIAHNTLPQVFARMGLLPLEAGRLAVSVSGQGRGGTIPDSDPDRRAVFDRLQLLAIRRRKPVSAIP
jgi:hypothetical protein